MSTTKIIAWAVIGAAIGFIISRFGVLPAAIALAVVFAGWYVFNRLR